MTERQAEFLGGAGGPAGQEPVRAHLVEAHLPQPRRVGVDRRRRDGPGLAHVVDVRRAERERAPLAEHRGRRRDRPDAQPPLGERPVDDGDGATTAIVVVEAGVLEPRPADQPDLEVLVEVESRVDALDGGVRHPAPPQLGPQGERTDHRLELAPAVLSAVMALCEPGVERRVAGLDLVRALGGAGERRHD